MAAILDAAELLARQPRDSPDFAIGDAEQLLARLAPLDFRVANTRAEHEAAYRFRYRCVIDEGWANAEQLPEAMEHDEHDDYATHILARHGELLVGTLRLVPPVSGRALPIEEDFDLRIEPVGEVVEGGRLVVAPAYRTDPRLHVLRGLFTRFWIEANRHGYSIAAFAAPARLARLYRWMGVVLEVVGPARHMWGEERLLMLAANHPPSLTN